MGPTHSLSHFLPLLSLSLSLAFPHHTNHCLLLLRHRREGLSLSHPSSAPLSPSAVSAYIDVRDVARAHVLVYERPDARGRYLCIGTVLHRAELLQMLGVKMMGSRWRSRTSPRGAGSTVVSRRSHGDELGAIVDADPDRWI
uniref:3-beta hydroxysteroid dehydrogenase/isomerase domain-containing protein n=1 Tax=Oryza meridionalis TaxID=40149 RepID=A0A0E0DIV1_9ORYZ